MRTAILALLLSASAVLVATAADPARPSPPFTIQRVGGPPMQLSQFHGKIVALAFISTTCPHCQALTGTLGPIAREYTPKGVQFLECAFNPNADQLVSQFIQQFQPPFPVGYSNDAAVRAYLGYSVMDQRVLYVPHMVFLDQKGMLRDDIAAEHPTFFLNTEASVRAELDKLLKEPATTAAAGGKNAKKK